MSSSRQCASVVLLWCLLIGAARAQQAQPAPHTLQGYIDDGVRLYAEGRYDEAIAAFTSAYTLRPIPRLLFNIAQSHRKAGRPAEALESYELYLREETQDAALRAEAQGHMTQLRAQLAPPVRQPVGGQPGTHLAQPSGTIGATEIRPNENAPAPRRVPVHRRGWFIGVVSVATLALIGTAIGLGVGLRDRTPPTTLGTIDPF